MASPSTVITRGYGTWGSVNELPTLGYGIGAAVTEYDTVCPMSVPLYDRANGSVPLLNRANLSVPLYDRSNMSVPLVGCRNDV